MTTPNLEDMTEVQRKAYAEAQIRIAKAKGKGATELRLSGFGAPLLRALTAIPAEVSGLNTLKILDLEDTQISDLSPLADLNALHILDLTSTQVSDLRPLESLQNLKQLRLSRTQVEDLAPLSNLVALETLSLTGTPVADLRPLLELDILWDQAGQGERTNSFGAIWFHETAATARDEKLNSLSTIEDNKSRAQQTREYLKTLPPWPEPLPWEPPLPPSSNKDQDSAELQALLEDAKKTARLLKTRDSAAKKTSDDLADVRTSLATLSKSLKAAQSAQEKAEADHIKRIEALSKDITDASDQLKGFQDETTKQIEAAKADYKRSIDAAAAAFSEDNANEEPVKLWEAKQTEHESARDRAFNFFLYGLGGVGVLVLLVIGIVAYADQTLNAIYAPVGCDPTNPTPELCKGFSFRGVVLTGGVLTLFTVMLWFTRLQMKLYLAERHLVLDARERQAFAQTYVGYLRMGDASKEAQDQRALVYSALFRPTTDGIVKEEGGIDPSLTAAISKVLAGR